MRKIYSIITEDIEKILYGDEKIAALIFLHEGDKLSIMPQKHNSSIDLKSVITLEQLKEINID